MSNQQHSRLGQILINKGLISAAQLDAAIQAQLSNHKRLGETLIEQGLLSERQLKKALKKQTNLRLAATLVAALLSPFQMASADIQRMQPPAAMSRQELPKNLRPLTDVEMSNVNAQGLNESLEGLFLKAEGGDGLAAVKQLAKLVMPMLDSLEAEVPGLPEDQPAALIPTQGRIVRGYGKGTRGCLLSACIKPPGWPGTPAGPEPAAFRRRWQRS